MLMAYWVDYMQCYRIYDPRYPEQTVAYTDKVPDDVKLIGGKA